MRMCVMNKCVFITRPKMQKFYNWLYATVVQRNCDDAPQATGSAGTKHQTLLCAHVYVCVCSKRATTWHKWHKPLLVFQSLTANSSTCITWYQYVTPSTSTLTLRSACTIIWIAFQSYIILQSQEKQNSLHKKACVCVLWPNYSP
jgi:hypothetical protein